MLPRLVALPHSPERWSAGSYFYARDSGRCPADFVSGLPPLSLSVICSRAPSREIIASPCPPVGFDRGFGLAITGYGATACKQKLAARRASTAVRRGQRGDAARQSRPFGVAVEAFPQRRC